MMIRNVALTVAGLGLVGLLSLPAQAAPSMSGGLSAAVPSSVEKANYGRRCWRRNGKLYCRRYVGRGHPYAQHGWGPGWGYGPGLNLYFGGGGRHGHHNRGHRGGRHHR